MSKVTVPAKKKEYGPSLSPVAYPFAVCSECGVQMHVDPIVKHGRLESLLLHCDTVGCQYSFEAQVHYVSGTTIKYQSPAVRKARS